MDADFEQFKEWVREYDESSEMVICNQMQALRATFGVFEGNYREVLELAKLTEVPQAKELWDVRNRGKLHAVMQEDSRRLHNFLASAKSLVDHTRNMIHRLYDATDFQNEYGEKVKTHFQASPVQHFVQGLRNYTQHYALPIAETMLTQSRQWELNRTLGINVTELRKWSNWPKLATKYMEGLGDHLSSKALAEEYFALVREFYRWLAERQADLHKADFERLEGKRQRIAQYLRARGLGPTPEVEE